MKKQENSPAHISIKLSDSLVVFINIFRIIRIQEKLTFFNASLQRHLLALHSGHDRKINASN